MLLPLKRHVCSSPVAETWRWIPCWLCSHVALVCDPSNQGSTEVSWWDVGEDQGERKKSHYSLPKCLPKPVTTSQTLTLLFCGYGRTLSATVLLQVNAQVDLPNVVTAGHLWNTRLWIKALKTVARLSQSWLKDIALYGLVGHNKVNPLNTQALGDTAQAESASGLPFSV